MKKFFTVLVVFLIIAGLVMGWSLWSNSNKASGLPQGSAVSKADSEYFYLPARFSYEKITDLPSAIAAMNDLKAELGFKKAAQVFSGASKNSIDDLHFYRLAQEYQDVPVFGRAMTVIANGKGEAQHVSGNYLNITDLSVKPKLKESEAKKKALEYMINTLNCQEASISIKGSGLSIYSLDLAPTLCWTFQASGQSEAGLEYRDVFVHARDGSIVQGLSTIYAYNATGQDGAQYDLPLTKEDGVEYLWDKTRNIQVFTLSYQEEVTKNMWEMQENAQALKKFTDGAEEVKLADKNLSGTDALGNVVAVYDFFHQILNRKQFDGKNGRLNVFVNGKRSEEDNAYYAQIDDDKSFIIFVVKEAGRKEYSKNLDFVAHEFSHGVTATTAGLISGNQPGAINEGLSDVFGELVEKQVTGVNDWSFAKERDMKNNKTVADYNESVSVHTNCAILNNASYLMGTGIKTGKFSKEQARLLNPDSPDKEGIRDFAKLLHGVQLMLPANATFHQYGSAMMSMANYLQSAGEITEAQLAGIKESLRKAGITPVESPLLLANTKTYAGSFTVKAVDGNYKPLPKYSLNIFEGSKTGESFAPVFSKVAATDQVLVSLPTGHYTAVVQDALTKQEEKYAFYVQSDVSQGNSYKEMTILCHFEQSDSTPASKPKSSQPKASQPAGAASGTISILSVSPRKATPGVETTFTLKVKYQYQNAQGCIIYAGANTEEADRYGIFEQYVLPDRSGTYTFHLTCTPAKWSSGDFALYANISEYPHADRWSPLGTAKVPIELSSKGSAGGFSLPGTWQAEDGSQIVFESDGTFTFDWGLGIVEHGTYSAESTSGDAFPIIMKGTSLIQMMQVLYGAADSSYHFEILKEDDDHISLVQVYGDYNVASSPCKLPLTRR